jgi:hypothetical protein
MRISTLLEWGAIFLVFAITILLIQNIGGLTSRDISGLSPSNPGTLQSSSECSGLGFGGFYQDSLSAPQPVVRQIDEWTFTINPVFRYTIVGKIVGKDAYSSGAADTLSPMDLAIANGDIISPENFRYFSFQENPAALPLPVLLPGRCTTDQPAVCQ